MSAASDYYSGSYDFDKGGNIYVHLHVGNIGRAMNGNPIQPSQVASIFRERKKQAFQASKIQFRTLFKNSLDNKSIGLLNEVFSNDDIMTKIQNEMGKRLEEALAVDKMQALMQIQRSKITTENFAKSILGDKKVINSISQFDVLLDSLEKAAEILGTEVGGNLAAVLRHEQNTINNRKQLGSFLSKALEKFQEENQKVLLSELQIKQAEQISGTINSLASALSTGKTKSDNKDITAKSIVKMTSDIFSTGFAESISAMLKNTAYVAIDQTFKAFLTGSETAEIEYSDQFGEIVGRSKGKAAYGKADAFFKNVKIKLEGTDNQVNINIGISDKFYRTNSFPGLKGNKKKNSYSSGSGGSLTEALWSSFGSNLKYLYYAYNSLGHGNRKGWDQAQGALNEVLLTRQIVRLFASRGGNQDFAQFMFVNGQIVPVWNIIMSTLNDISLSSSQHGQHSQPVTLSISDRGDIQKAAQARKNTLEERIYNVNKAVRKAKITAHVNLDYL